MTVKILKIAMRHLVATVAPVRNKNLKNSLDDDVLHLGSRR